MSSAALRILWAACIATVMTPGRVSGDGPPGGTYGLEVESSALVGCLDLCDCLIREVPDLGGAFTIEPAEAGATFTRYRVEDVAWVIGGEEPIVAHGSGTFEVRLEGEDELESFDLLLTINDEPPQAFSSAPRVRDEKADEIVAAVRPTELVCAGQVFQLHAKLGSAIPFVRADCNADRSIDVSDAVRALFVLLGAAPAPECEAACDGNGDDRLDIADPVAVLSFLFALGPPPPSPFPSCAPSDTLLGCAAFPACS